MSFIRRIPAFAIALVFAYGGLRLVLGDALNRPSQWTDYQILTLLLIAGTIGAGHFTKTAWKQGAILSCLGFALVFVTGTYLSARQSLDRQAETAAATTLSAEAVNGTLAGKADDLAEAKKRLKYAEDQVQSESTGQRCGERCERWKRTAADRRTVVASIERDIAALGPPKPVNAGREHFGATAAAMGFDKAGAMGFDALLMPFLKFFVFEIGSIVSLGFALHSGPKTNSASAKPNSPKPKPNSVSSSDDTGPDQSGPSDSPTVRTEKQKALSEVLGILAEGRTIPSQDYLAEHWNRPKQTVSDWMRDWRRIGVIPSETKAGRCKATVPA